MRRHVIPIVLIAIIVLSASRTASGGCYTELRATPAMGMAPLTVAVRGTVWGWEPVVVVDLGGEATFQHEIPWETSDGTCEIGFGFGTEHTFDCPGTYQITAFEVTVTVTVTAPKKPHLFVFSGDSANEAYLATHFYVAERPFAYSTVDWGDGTTETFTWTPRGVYIGTPNHLYAADGVYTASVTNHYIGQYCSWDETVTAIFRVPNPTPTNMSTWGSVKALYHSP